MDTTSRTHKIILLALLSLATAGPALAQYEYVGGFGSTGSTSGRFNKPKGVAVESGGKIVVSDAGNNRIQVCSEAGSCSSFGGPGTLTGEFDKPREVDMDPSTNEIAIADRGNDRFQICTTWGSCDSAGGSGTGRGQFESPRGIAVLNSSQLVIADTEHNRIQVCTHTASCTTFGTLGGSPGQFDGPAGVAVNSSGRIVVADRLNDRIQVCTTSGSCTAFGSRGSAPGQFNAPAGVAVDSQDRIIVADQGNDRVQVCDSGGNCTAFGSSGSANGSFNGPWGVAVDGNNRIIVSDQGNNRIQIFAEQTAPPPDPVSIDSFSVSPSQFEAGGSTTVSWSVSNADTCTPTGGAGGWSGLTLDPVSGSVDITIDVAGQYTFTLDCSNAGSSDSKRRTVTVTAPPPPAFTINAGLNDAWFYPVTAGQGFFIIVWEDIKIMFLAWFTYDTQRPPGDVTAILGEPGHRWITAQGPYDGDTATLDIFVSSGGVFDLAPPDVTNTPDGTMTVTFSGCNEGLVSYTIESLGISGEVPIERIVLDKVPLCESRQP